ncbi:MAG: MOSC domain-containing protein [Bryobacter sp.]|jgi:MOSC domain-containing protein YiiM|nr:MOSC domain-containing protein [Bryobacter sp. CoA8 C33]
MTGKICHLNVSRGGIPKRELNPARLTALGLEGDDWAHPKYHGGPEQALLLIGEEVIGELRQQGYEVYAGALGENLTTRGLDYEKLRAGQRFRLGQECEIELTKLREPCRTLDVYNRGGMGKIQKILKQEGRGGWYARVLRGGHLFAGDRIELVAETV